MGKGTEETWQSLLHSKCGISRIELFDCSQHACQIAPPTINQENPDPECDLDYIPNVARQIKIDYALTNSFGFGGTNGALIFKKFEG